MRDLLGKQWRNWFAPAAAVTQEMRYMIRGRVRTHLGKTNLQQRADRGGMPVIKLPVTGRPFTEEYRTRLGFISRSVSCRILIV